MATITLRELVVPDVTYHALFIEYPEVTVPFELKSGLTHLIQKFHDLASEDHNKHLNESSMLCALS